MPQSDVRRRPVTVLLTDKEHSHLTRIAWLKHSSISTWVRDLIVKELVKEINHASKPAGD